jgi:hypothetical protein
MTDATACASSRPGPPSNNGLQSDVPQAVRARSRALGGTLASGPLEES